MITRRPLTFPQSRRMKTPAEFDRCYKRKRSASDDVLIVYACENGLDHPRLGCSVSKKVGNAVVRNRYKRLFREAFRLTQHDLPAGVDLVLIPRPGERADAGERSRESLVKLARQAARKLGEGKRPDPPAPFPKREGEQEGRDRELPPLALARSGVCDRRGDDRVRSRLPEGASARSCRRMCRFQPACSEYFILAVKKHGPICGCAKGVWRSAGATRGAGTDTILHN